MISWHSGHPKSIAVTWFVSYLAVLLVPLCVFVVFSLRYMSALSTEIEYFNSLSIKQVQRYVDNVVQEAHSIAGGLDSADEIKKVLRHSDRAGIPVLDLYAAQERISRTHTYVKGIEDIYLFCPDLDLTLYKSSYTSSKFYFQSYLSDSTLTYDSWYSFVAERSPSARIMDFSFRNPADDTEKMLLVCPLTVIPHGQMYTNLVIVLDRSIFQPEAGSGRQFHNILITDMYSHKVVYNSSPNVIKDSMLDSRYYVPGKLTLSQKTAGNIFMAAGVDSEVLNWKYLVMEKRSDYFGQASFIQHTAIICLAACFILGVIFVAYMTRRSYQPLHEVVQTINRDGMQRKSENEFTFINSAIEKMQEDKKYLVRNQLITKLVEKFDNRALPSRSELAAQGIVFQSNLFAVMVYRVTGSEDSAEYRQRIQNIINRAFTSASILVFFFDLKDYIGAVLNIPEGRKSDALYEQMGICIETMNRLENRRVPAACSNIVSTYYDLYTAFVQAVDTLKYASAVTETTIRFYKDVIAHAAGQTFDYPVEKEILIMDELRKGNEQTVMDCIDDVIRKNQEMPITPKSTRFLLLNISGTIIKVFSRLDEKVLAMYPDISLRPVLEDTTVDIFRDDIKKIVHDICDVQRRDTALIKDREEFSLYTAVLSYINEQYANFNLSVNLIADELKLTPVALSRLFKKYNGMCISDYINSVRIMHAKQLLRTGAGLAVIAPKCGFSSLRTFMRVFKNMEAMTPGQFEIMAGGK